MYQSLDSSIWEYGEVPHDFKDALIIHIYKRKGDRASCDNHRGISLLSVAGKIPGHIIVNRLSSHVFRQDMLYLKASVGSALGVAQLT